MSLTLDKLKRVGFTKIKCLLIAIVMANFSIGQVKKAYDLAELAAEGKLERTSTHQEIKAFINPVIRAISVKGIAWLSGVDFTKGTIDIDLRGRNIFLQSFMGIAFHGLDTLQYEVVYFCPFRFRDSDEVTRKYSVKYMSLPGKDYLTLRKEFPGVYENQIASAPSGDEWFHARIVVDADSVAVFINHTETPCLKVRRLGQLKSGKIGLWSYSKTLDSDFASLSIGP
jgi:hypothetical protein